MKFYNLDGKGIKKEEFVDLYSKDYFLRDDPLFKHNRSSSHIEDEITKILENGIHNGEEGKREVARILAWKVGKIDHEESQKNQRFEYIIDWKNAETLEGVKIVGKYPIKDAVEYIVREKNELAEKDPQDFLNELKDKEIFKGIGFVYMTTLLYFLSKGTYPIYDRFAHQAAKAIYFEVNPDDVYVGLAPGKTEINRFLRMYNEYCWLLKQIFGGFKIRRDVDQALWVYGHACIKISELNDSDKDFKVLKYK